MGCIFFLPKGVVWIKVSLDTIQVHLSNLKLFFSSLSKTRFGHYISVYCGQLSNTSEPFAGQFLYYMLIGSILLESLFFNDYEILSYIWILSLASNTKDIWILNLEFYVIKIISSHTHTTYEDLMPLNARIPYTIIPSSVGRHAI